MSKTISTVLLSTYALSSSSNPLYITTVGGVETNGGTAIYGGSTQAWTITNAGTVSGGSAAGSLGIDLRAGGTIGNTGLISGNHYAIRVRGAAGTVTNAGSITSQTDGVVLFAGGSVSNAAGGVIAGTTNVGVYISGGAGTVTNAGTIDGTPAAVQFVGAFADRLIVDPGAVFIGKIIGGSGSNVLELAAGTATGTLSAFPTNFTGFGTINVDSSATWQFDSTDTIGGAVVLTDAGTLGNAGLIDTTVTVAGGGSLCNTGTVNAGSAQFGVTLLAGGVVSNTGAGALIEGTRYGIRAVGGAATVINNGLILGTSPSDGGGVGLYAGGTVTNAGTIVSGNYYGVYVNGGLGTVTNSGTIISGDGVGLFAGGTVSNTGSINSTISYGVYVTGGAGTVTNAGTIGGGADAVRFAGAFSDRVIIDPGAVFQGKVAGGSGSNTLELAQGNSAIGTLSGFSTSFTGFGAITIDAGASWTFDTTDALGSGISLIDAGTLLFSQTAGSSQDVAAAISGSGKVEQSGPGTLVLDGINDFTGGLIIAGGTLELSAGNAAGSGPIDFAGDPTLRLDGTIMPTGTVSGLSAGDAIDLEGVSFASGGSATIINSNTLQVVENSASYDLTLDPLQDFSHFAFNPTPDGGTGTLITVDPACYCRGTRILTIGGEIAVEDLQVGDRVMTLSGASRPVRWIGRRHLDLTRHPTPDRIRPIRIRANAFADTVPRRDLLLSPDHAVLCEGRPGDGMLVPARLLLNGASIVRDTHHRAVTYYHVELDAHDILLAENLPAESYLDTGNRGLFENAGGALVLHPDLTGDQARRRAWSCAPFADDPARTEPIWRALAARTVQLGWHRPSEPETTEDPDLRLLVDGRQVAPVSVSTGRHVFIVPRIGAAVRLASRTAVPSETCPWIADDRSLGILLRGLRMRTGAMVVPIPLDHPDLREGWWQPEWHGPTALRRWTNGDAAVPMPGAALGAPGPCLLEVEIAGALRYRLPDPSPASMTDRRPPCHGRPSAA
ncbi:Hint domain-containing protein [Acidisphaera sp. S103]|uniref:Hint domain-containing protein n=1 Tax=Acidisphaera sp. S103 TaxID=1747223 RepID=UPI00131B80B1|nr:Hint domain-containing protein [Acidisphaera sp. S103]